MSAPRRWKESPDAPIGVRELFGAARPRRPLDEHTFARGKGRLAKLTAPAAIAATSAIWTKIALAGASALVVAGTVVAVESLALRTEQEPPDVPTGPQPGAQKSAQTGGPKAASVVISRVPVSTASISPPELLEPTEAPSRPALRASPDVAAPAPVRSAAPSAASSPIAPLAPEPSPSPSPSPSPEPSRGALAGELALLQEARSLLARDPEASLRELAIHRERYPSGVLAAERDLLELDALRRAGRVHDARVRARAWLERDPRGIHADRVRAILASVDAAR